MMKKIFLYFLIFLTFFECELKALESSELKAIFVFKLINFVEPPNRDKNDHKPLKILFIGKEDEFQLHETLYKKLKNDFTYTLDKHSGESKNYTNYDLIILGNSFESTYKGEENILKNTLVISLGENTSWSLIKLKVKNNKIAFDVNFEEVDKSNLRISSRILRLADNRK